MSPKANYLTELYQHCKSNQPLWNTICAWDGDIVDGDMPDTIYMNHQIFAPGSPVALTKTEKFDAAQTALQFSNSLIKPPLVIYESHKRAYVPVEVYANPNLVDSLL